MCVCVCPPGLTLNTSLAAASFSASRPSLYPRPTASAFSLGSPSCCNSVLSTPSSTPYLVAPTRMKWRAASAACGEGTQTGRRHHKHAGDTQTRAQSHTLTRDTSAQEHAHNRHTHTTAHMQASKDARKHTPHMRATPQYLSHIHTGRTDLDGGQVDGLILGHEGLRLHEGIHARSRPHACSAHSLAHRPPQAYTARLGLGYTHNDVVMTHTQQAVAPFQSRRACCQRSWRRWPSR